MVTALYHYEANLHIIIRNFRHGHQHMITLLHPRGTESNLNWHTVKWKATSNVLRQPSAILIANPTANYRTPNTANWRSPQHSHRLYPIHALRSTFILNADLKLNCRTLHPASEGGHNTDLHLHPHRYCNGKLQLYVPPSFSLLT